ncbi:NAD(P)-dependent oxidoreductase [Sphingomonas sp. H39-1-10]|uniref:NAD(P)-dependent oxidoreductase n=1 Tax=Sphingomonas pollutisoli TaxID=3030829 RepID=UPI0023B990C2|nr:NAD(P)-dependent oxidoreductase [Sphingomonas pollutisoli]MDF0489326.1 NAD(P)-dependent oxidoreductase [Sphingomonas pollutisoli]
MQVGLIGLGAMGRGMAENLAKAGHDVLIWNRSGDGGKPIAGARMVDTPVEVFQSDLVLTMLSDDAAIRSVVLDAGLLAGARAGVIHAVTATISVAFAEELAAAHAAAGIGYLSAPVFGRPDAAAAGQLSVVVAGDAAAIETARPAFKAISRKIWVLGEHPRQANAAKIAGNMMITFAIEAMAEALVLTGDNGVTTEAFFELMLGTLFGGRIYETYSASIAAGKYEPGFRMQLGLKDLRLATEAAQAAGKRLPMLEAVRTRMSEAVDAGMGEKDWSAIAQLLLRKDD